MAVSPVHKLGQIIGGLLERSMRKPLEDFVIKYPELYLDKKGYRPARINKRKVSWIDINNNYHDLDFVIERTGTKNKIGKPIAFIEVAWRRYTKHSKNKAQEIQGAILPLAEKYKWESPFIGVILGGTFTEGSLTQLKSCGFTVLYFDYDTIMKAFDAVGIDARFDEDTPDSSVSKKLKAYKSLTVAKITTIENHLRESKVKEIDAFIKSLSKVVIKGVKSITISSFHGKSLDLDNLNDAVDYITKYTLVPELLNLVKFEITIRYFNGDKIEGSFSEKATAIKFLKDYCG